jgi:hypothetical protein
MLSSSLKFDDFETLCASVLRLKDAISEKGLESPSSTPGVSYLSLRIYTLHRPLIALIQLLPSTADKI